MNSFQNSDQADFDSIASSVDRGSNRLHNDFMTINSNMDREFREQRGILSTIKSGVGSVGQGIANVGRGIKNVYDSNKQDFGVNTEELKSRLATGIAGPVGTAINQAMSNAGISFGGIIKKSVGGVMNMFHGHGSNGDDFGRDIDKLNGINNRILGNDIQDLDIQKKQLQQGEKQNHLKEKQIQNDTNNANRIVSSIRDLEDNLSGNVNRRTGKKSNIKIPEAHYNPAPKSHFQSGLNSSSYQPSKNVINSINRMSRDGSYSDNNTSSNTNSSPNDIATLLGEIIKNQQLQQQYNQDPNADKTGLGHQLMDMGLTMTGLKFWFSGRYAHDIPRSTNPMETLVNGMIKIYEWERIGIDLSRRQLNELIKLQGGQPQKYVGHEGVFTAYVKNKIQKLSNGIEASFGNGLVGKTAKFGLGIAKFLAFSDEDWKDQGVAKAHNYLDNIGNPRRRKQISDSLSSAKYSRDYVQAALGTDLDEEQEEINLQQTINSRRSKLDSRIKDLKNDPDVLFALQQFNEANQNENGYDPDKQKILMKKRAKELQEVVNRAREKYGLKGMLGSSPIENGNIISNTWYGKSNGEQNVEEGKIYSIDDLIIDKYGAVEERKTADGQTIKGRKSNLDRKEELDKLGKILNTTKDVKVYDQTRKRIELILEELESENTPHKNALTRATTIVPVEIVGGSVFKHIDNLLGGSRDNLNLADQIVYGLENSKIGIATRNVNDEISDEILEQYTDDIVNKETIKSIAEGIVSEKESNSRERDGLDTEESLADEAQIQSADDISTLKDTCKKLLENSTVVTEIEKKRKKKEEKSFFEKLFDGAGSILGEIGNIGKLLIPLGKLALYAYGAYKAIGFGKDVYDKVSSSLDKFTSLFGFGKDGEKKYSEEHKLTTIGTSLKPVMPVAKLASKIPLIGKPFKIVKPLAVGIDALDGTNRLMDGEHMRGSSQLIAAGMNFVPGVGWVASTGMNGATILGDSVAKATGSEQLGEHATKTAAQEVSTVVGLATKGVAKGIEMTANGSASAFATAASKMPNFIGNSKVVGAAFDKIANVAPKATALAGSAGKFVKVGGGVVAGVMGGMDTYARAKNGDTSGAIIAGVGTVANVAAQFGGPLVGLAVNLLVQDALMINDLIGICNSIGDTKNENDMNMALEDFDFLIDQNVHNALCDITSNNDLDAKDKAEQIADLYHKWLKNHGKLDLHQRVLAASRNKKFIKEYKHIAAQLSPILMQAVGNDSKRAKKLNGGFQAYCYDKWKENEFKGYSGEKVNAIFEEALKNEKFHENGRTKDSNSWFIKSNAVGSRFDQLKELHDSGKLSDEEYKKEVYFEYDAYRKNNKYEGIKYIQELEADKIKGDDLTEDDIKHNQDIDQRISKVKEDYDIYTKEERKKIAEEEERKRVEESRKQQLQEQTNSSTQNLQEAVQQANQPVVEGTDRIVKSVESNPELIVGPTIENAQKLREEEQLDFLATQDILSGNSDRIVDSIDELGNKIVNALPDSRYDNGGIINVAPGIQYTNKPQFGKTSFGQKYLWGEGHDGKGAGEYKISTGTHDIFLPEKREPGNMTDILMKNTSFADGGITADNIKNQINPFLPNFDLSETKTTVPEIKEGTSSGVKKAVEPIKDSVQKIANSKVGKETAKAVESTKEYITGGKLKSDISKLGSTILGGLENVGEKISTVFGMGLKEVQDLTMDLNVDPLDESKGTYKDQLIKQFKDNKDLASKLKTKDEKGNEITLDIDKASDEDILKSIKESKDSDVQKAWDDAYNKATEWNEEEVNNTIKKIEEQEQKNDIVSTFKNSEDFRKTTGLDYDPENLSDEQKQNIVKLVTDIKNKDWADRTEQEDDILQAADLNSRFMIDKKFKVKTDSNGNVIDRRPKKESTQVNNVEQINDSIEDNMQVPTQQNEPLSGMPFVDEERENQQSLTTPQQIAKNVKQQHKKSHINHETGEIDYEIDGEKITDVEKKRELVRKDMDDDISFINRQIENLNSKKQLTEREEQHKEDLLEKIERIKNQKALLEEKWKSNNSDSKEYTEISRPGYNFKTNITSADQIQHKNPVVQEYFRMMFQSGEQGIYVDDAQRAWRQYSTQKKYKNTSSMMEKFGRIYHQSGLVKTYNNNLQKEKQKSNESMYDVVKRTSNVEISDDLKQTIDKINSDEAKNISIEQLAKDFSLTSDSPTYTGAYETDNKIYAAAIEKGLSALEISKLSNYLHNSNDFENKRNAYAKSMEGNTEFEKYRLADYDNLKKQYEKSGDNEWLFNTEKNIDSKTDDNVKKAHAIRQKAEEIRKNLLNSENKDKTSIKLEEGGVIEDRNIVGSDAYEKALDMNSKYCTPEMILRSHELYQILQAYDSYKSLKKSYEDQIDNNNSITTGIKKLFGFSHDDGTMLTKDEDGNLKELTIEQQLKDLEDEYHSNDGWLSEHGSHIDLVKDANGKTYSPDGAYKKQHKKIMSDEEFEKASAEYRFLENAIMGKGDLNKVNYEDIKYVGKQTRRLYNNDKKKGLFLEKFADGGIQENNAVPDMKVYNTDSRNSAINNISADYINSTRGQQEATEQTLNGLHDMSTVVSQNSMNVINKMSHGGSPVINNITNNNYERNAMYEFVEGSPANMRA